MKYVYVLTSYGEDFYAEQAAISIYTLRKFHPESEVVLITEKETLTYLKEKKSSLASMADKIIAPEMPEELSRFQKSRFLKTSIRQLVEGDFIFLDTDTLILDSLTELECLPYDMGVALQQDGPDWSIDNPHFHMKKYNVARGIDPDTQYGIKNFFNSGIMLCRDTQAVRDLFKMWHERWYESSTVYGYHADQCDLWISDVAAGHIIKELDGRYNCMAICPDISLRYFSDCKIFHYFSNSRKWKYLKVKSPEFLLRFRENGFTNEIDDMVDNIRVEYLKGLDIREKDAEKQKGKKNLLPKEDDKILVIIAKKINKRFPVIDKALTKLYKLIF